MHLPWSNTFLQVLGRYTMTWVLGGWPDPTLANAYHSQSGLLRMYDFLHETSLLVAWCFVKEVSTGWMWIHFPSYTFSLLTCTSAGHPKIKKWDAGCSRVGWAKARRQLCSLRVQAFDFVFAPWPGRSQVWARNLSSLSSKSLKKSSAMLISPPSDLGGAFELGTFKGRLWTWECVRTDAVQHVRFDRDSSRSWTEIGMSWEVLDTSLLKPQFNRAWKTSVIFSVSCGGSRSINNNVTEVAFSLKYARKEDFPFPCCGSSLSYSRAGTKYGCHKFCHF